MRKNEFVVETFVNEFGQSINPEDNVLFVGSSWGGTSVNVGKYSGVFKNDDGEIVSVKVTYPTTRKKYTVDPNLPYGHPNKFTYEVVNYEGWSILTLKRIYKIDQSNRDMVEFMKKAI